MNARMVASLVMSAVVMARASGSSLHYQLVGGGLCRNPVNLPGHEVWPALLYPSDPTHALADADPVAECLKRCVAAFDDIMDGGVRAFYVDARAG